MQPVINKRMTSHRQSSDSQFDTHLSSLADDTLANKKTAWTSLKSDLGGENTELFGHQNQISKHRKKVNDMLEDLETLEAFQLAVAIPASKVVYVNASAPSSGADGSIAKPYSDLQVAIDAKCAVGDAADRIFDIASGVYTCSRTIVKSAGVKQNVTFRGSGRGKTIIQASASYGAGMALYIFRPQLFGDLEFFDCTFRNCLYALRPDSCSKFSVERCEFVNCGASSDSTNFDASLSKSAQGLRFTDASLQKLSNGGAIRCDTASGRVSVVNVHVFQCLRSIRLSACSAGGLVKGCYCRDTAESAIYLNTGTVDVTVTSNTIVRPGNNGILLSSCQNCVVSNNVIRDPWNCPIQVWNSSDITVECNQTERSNYMSWNAVGNDSDSWAGGIHIAGNAGISSTAEYQTRVINNSFILCGLGRAPEVRAIVYEDAALTSPESCNKNYVDGNYSDAAVHLKLVDANPPAIIDLKSYKKQDYTTSSKSISFTSLNQKLPTSAVASGCKSGKVDISFSTSFATGNWWVIYVLFPQWALKDAVTLWDFTMTGASLGSEVDFSEVVTKMNMVNCSFQDSTGTNHTNVDCMRIVFKNYQILDTSTDLVINWRIVADAGRISI